MSNNIVIVHSNELYHHGIKGQKWGIRRFQPYPKGSASKGKFVGKAKKAARTIERADRDIATHKENLKKDKKGYKIDNKSLKRNLKNQTKAIVRRDRAIEAYKNFPTKGRLRKKAKFEALAEKASNDAEYSQLRVNNDKYRINASKKAIKDLKKQRAKGYKALRQALKKTAAYNKTNK